MATSSFADGFADRLRQARERAGFTQRELGAEAGINYSQVSRYEQGVAFPRPGVLQRLADVLAVPVEHLRSGDEFVTLPVGDSGHLRVTFTPEAYLKLKAEADSEGFTVEQFVVLLAKEHLARVAAEDGGDSDQAASESRLSRITKGDGKR
ncbi:helix-turn-helix domain-containing protein [Stenotrophomonas sp. LARHCG68]